MSPARGLRRRSPAPLRSHLLTERGADKALASISGYRRVGNTEEGFRSWKSEQSKAGSA